MLVFVQSIRLMCYSYGIWRNICLYMYSVCTRIYWICECIGWQCIHMECFGREVESSAIPSTIQSLANIRKILTCVLRCSFSFDFERFRYINRSKTVGIPAEIATQENIVKKRLFAQFHLLGFCRVVLSQINSKCLGNGDECVISCTNIVFYVMA